jgi:hypothetical protein
MADLYLRQETRYQLNAPVSYWWSCSKGEIQEGNGVTRDISQTGVFVETAECPPAGTPVQMTVSLPRLGGDGSGMKLHGEGVVVRVEDNNTAKTKTLGKSFAASVRFYPDSDRSVQVNQGSLEKLRTALQ